MFGRLVSRPKLLGRINDTAGSFTMRREGCGGVVDSVQAFKRGTEEKRMRAILLAILVAIGIALVGTSNLSAAPASGSAIGDAAAATDVVGKVQHWRFGSGGG